MLLLKNLIIRKKFFWLVIALAILSGVFYSAPQIFIWHKLTKINQPYAIFQYITHNDTVKGDLPKAREIYDGHFPPVELSLEPKGTSVFPFVPHTLTAFLIWVSGGNMNFVYLLANLIFPALIFLGFYLVGLIFIRNRWWAIFLASLGTLTPIARFFSEIYRSNLWEKFLNIVVKNFVPLVNTPLDRLFLSKINDPLLTYVFYLLALAAIFWFWRKSCLLTAIVTGLMSGLMIYTYFHYSIFLYLFVFLLVVFAVWRRKENASRFKYGLVLLGILFLVSLPYLVNYFSLKGLATYDDYIHRIGLEEGRYFRLEIWRDYLAYALLAVVIYLVIYKKDKTKAVFYFLSFLAILVAWNIQLITGFIPEPNHWWYTFSPLMFIMAVDLIYNLLRNPVSKSVLAVLAVLILLLIAKKVVNATLFINLPSETLNKYTISRDLVNSWDWINANLNGEPVILSDSFMTTIYLNVYTSVRPYVPNWLNTLASNYQVEERFLTANKILGVSEEILEKQLNTLEGGCREIAAAFKINEQECSDPHTRFNLSEPMFQLYGIYYFRPRSYKEYTTTGTGQPLKKIPELKIQELTSRFRQMKTNWSDIEADYVYFGPWERQFSKINLENNKSLNLIYHNSSVEIYEIKK